MLYGMANNNAIIPAQRDGALYNFLLGNQDYVFEGIGNEFAITSSASSFLITLGTGEGVVCGRHVTEETVNNANSMIQLDANSSGYVVIRVDLSRPAGTEAYLYATLALRSDDLNNGGSVHDLPLYQYTTNGTGVSSFTDIRPLSSGSNVVCLLENGNIYVEQWVDGVKTRKQVGSLDPENLTATPSDVKAGKIFGGQGSDDPQTGTFTAQTKTVTPSTSAQTITPDSGKYLSSVSVSAANQASVNKREWHSTSSDIGYSGVLDTGSSSTSKWAICGCNNGIVYLYGSNDNSNWTELGSAASEGNNSASGNIPRSIATVTRTGTYRYWRARRAGYNNGGNGCLYLVVVG